MHDDPALVLVLASHKFNLIKIISNTEEWRDNDMMQTTYNGKNQIKLIVKKIKNFIAKLDKQCNFKSSPFSRYRQQFPSSLNSIYTEIDAPIQNLHK